MSFDDEMMFSYVDSWVQCTMGCKRFKAGGRGRGHTAMAFGNWRYGLQRRYQGLQLSLYIGFVMYLEDLFDIFQGLSEDRDGSLGALPILIQQPMHCTLQLPSLEHAILLCRRCKGINEGRSVAEKGWSTMIP